HGLRNAAIPVITVTGVQIAALIIGAVVIERVFVIPGLGSMLLDAVGNRDMLTVQSVVMVLVAITLILNLVVDVLYTLIDPRLRRSA
ncbi:ABC transporter permease, partial [Leucobacter chromiiresistens]